MLFPPFISSVEDVKGDDGHEFDDFHGWMLCNAIQSASFVSEADAESRSITAHVSDLLLMRNGGARLDSARRIHATVPSCTDRSCVSSFPCRSIIDARKETSEIHWPRQTLSKPRTFSGSPHGPTHVLACVIEKRDSVVDSTNPCPFAKEVPTCIRE